MNDEIKVIETINKVFINSDERKWDQVIESFADKVFLDYSSMTGVEPQTLTPEQIVSSWKDFLPLFKATHHQIGNYIVSIKEENANVFCYGTATHYFPTPSNQNVWIVVGSYNIGINRQKNNWKINSFKFNLKYQDGNTELPKLIQEVK